MGVVCFVEWIGKCHRGRRRNCAFTAIGLIAKSPDRFALHKTVSTPVIDPSHKPANSTRKIALQILTVDEPSTRGLFTSRLIFEHGFHHLLCAT